MAAIDEFMEQYRRAYEFYAKLSRACANQCEIGLRGAGVRHMVTHRAKSLPRLRSKVEKRNAVKNYVTAQAIYSDIRDLAGVRIGLYFPGDRPKVREFLEDTFDIVEPPRVFPTENTNQESSSEYTRRFKGYSAVHYLVALKQDQIGDLAYAGEPVEIQIASVLMHSWAEVEHDLLYKPVTGEVSEDEYAILAEINGLVLAGEIALERLQRAIDRRVGRNMKFDNHYDMASYLYQMVRESGRWNTDPVMGRTDVLFRFLTLAGLIDDEHWLEDALGQIQTEPAAAPIAEQIADLALEKRPSEQMFQLYRQAQNESRINPFLSPRDKDGLAQRAVASFLSSWIKLEQTVGMKAEQLGVAPPRYSPGRTPWHPVFETFARDALGNFRELQSMRNMLVHGQGEFSPDELVAATNMVDEITHRLEVSKKDTAG